MNTKNKTLEYYKNNTESELLGEVDLDTIVDVVFSKVFDAPEFSIDLVSMERHYTLTAESHLQMLRWAYAIKLVVGKNKTSQKMNGTDNSAVSNNSTNKKWYRYDYEYVDPGPLYLNVMGSTRRDGNKGLKIWITVIAFEPTPDGTPGRSEKSGVICVGDYLVGCNGQDLTGYTFNEAMEVIVASDWPKTLHFLRDTERIRVANRKEDWLIVYYPSLNRKRKRYVEFRNDALHFRKLLILFSLALFY